MSFSWNDFASWLTAIGTIGATWAAVRISIRGNKEYRDAKNYQSYLFLKNELYPFLEKSDQIHDNKFTNGTPVLPCIDEFGEKWVANQPALNSDLNKKVSNIIDDFYKFNKLSTSENLKKYPEMVLSIRVQLKRSANEIIRYINKNYQTHYDELNEDN